jgi:SAM-dependent methyltransferase
MPRSSRNRELPAVEEDALDESDAFEDEGSGAPQRGAPDYLERNRAAWHRWASASALVGEKAWRADELRWGLWNTPESHLHLLRELAPGSDVIEFGCGAAGICAWLKRGGMFPVGLDFSRTQLSAAEGLQREFGLSFPLIPANAEEVPMDQDSFDLVISEYGASIWSNPRRWLPEAHRVLRLGGQLIFFTNAAILMACTPADGGPAVERLVRDYFSSYRIEFGDDTGVEFHLTHGQWVRLLRATGFAVDNLIELRPLKGAVPRHEFVPLEWAQRWPSEEIWVARKIAERAPDLGLDIKGSGKSTRR